MLMKLTCCCKRFMELAKNSENESVGPWKSTSSLKFLNVLSIENLKNLGGPPIVNMKLVSVSGKAFWIITSKCSSWEIGDKGFVIVRTFAAKAQVVEIDRARLLYAP